MKKILIIFLLLTLSALTNGNIQCSEPVEGKPFQATCMAPGNSRITWLLNNVNVGSGTTLRIPYFKYSSNTATITCRYKSNYGSGQYSKSFYKSSSQNMNMNMNMNNMNMNNMNMNNMNMNHQVVSYKLRIYTVPTQFRFGSRLKLYYSISPSAPGASCTWFANKRNLGSQNPYVINSFGQQNQIKYFIRCTIKGRIIEGYINFQASSSTHYLSLRYTRLGSIFKIEASMKPTMPNVQFIWYKNGMRVQTGRYFTIDIEKNDAIGTYYCKAKIGSRFVTTIFTITSSGSFRLKTSENSQNNQNIQTTPPPTYPQPTTPPRTFPRMTTRAPVAYRFGIVSGPRTPKYSELPLYMAGILSPPVSNAEFTWFKNDQKIGSKQKYIIQSFTLRDRALYKCVVKFLDHTGQMKVMSKVKDYRNVILNNLRRKKIIPKIEKIKNYKLDIKVSTAFVSVGKQLVLTLVTQPVSSRLTYVWKKNGKTISTSQIYTISRFGIGDIASYQVFAYQSGRVVGKMHIDYSTVYLGLRPSGRGINLSIDKENIRKGSTVTLTYSMHSRRKSGERIFWLKNGEYIQGNIQTFTIRNFGINDLAIYKVVIVSSTLNSRYVHEWSTIDLTNYIIQTRSRRVLVSITTPTTSIKKGYPVTLRVSVAKPSNVKFIWYKNHELISYTQNLMISKFGVRDLAYYRLVMISINDKVPYIHEWTEIDLTRVKIGMMSTSVESPGGIFSVPTFPEYGKPMLLFPMVKTEHIRILIFKDGSYVSYNTLFIKKFSLTSLASYRFVYLSIFDNNQFVQYYDIRDYSSIAIFPTQMISTSTAYISLSNPNFRKGDSVTLTPVIEPRVSNVLYAWYKNGDFYMYAEKLTIRNFDIKYLAVFKFVARSKTITTRFILVNVVQDFTTKLLQTSSSSYRLVVERPKVKITKGAKYTLTCKIVPYNKNVRLLWFKDGSYYSQLNTITFYKFNIADLASYKCFALSYSTYSTYIHVWSVVDYSSTIITTLSTVKYTTSIKLSSENIKKGSKVSLIPVVKPAVTNVLYAWYKDGDFVAYGSTLTIGYFSMSNIRSYKFTVRSISEKNGPYIFIVMYQDFTKIMIQKPTTQYKVIIKPSKKKITLGTSLILRCSTEPVSSRIVYRWYKNGEYSSNSPVYAIKSFGPNDLASYRCMIISKDEFGPYIHAWTFIDYSRMNIFPTSLMSTVKYKISISYSTSSLVSGQSVSLIPKVYPPVTNVRYAWYLNGEFVSYGSTLCISKLSISSIGSYSFVVISIKPTLGRYILISQQKPITAEKVVGLPKTRYTVRIVKKNKLLLCMISPMTTDVYYGWIRNGVFLKETKSAITVNSGCASQAIIYTCVVRSYSYINPPIYAYASYKMISGSSAKSLKFTFHVYIDVSGPFVKNDALVLLCKVLDKTAAKAAKFMWFKNDKLISSKSGYAILKMSSCDNGQYKCVATIGTFKASASMYINIV